MNILHIQFKLFFHSAFLALLWFFWTVLTPVSPATFLCPLPQFSLCSHIFFQKNFGADVSETIFNPLIQRPMCVQTISCTKRIRASHNFLFGVFTFLLFYMHYSSFFSNEDQPHSTKIAFLFIKNLMSFSFGDKFSTLKLD